eukprot:Rhum_TRINITY_DN14099_c1_g1::Rhum_TRINITY_DN14099_c1_g1_i1::g.67695::m.67695
MWGSPPWRGGSLFSAGPKWDPQQQQQQQQASPPAAPQVQPPVGRSGGTEGDDIAQLRRENEALKRKVAEMEREREGEHSLKEAFRMLQNERTELKQDRDSLRHTVKKLQESLREKEWYNNDRKPAGDAFDGNGDWSPNGSSSGGGGGGADSSTHEEWSDDVATRIQQKVDSATRLLGTIKADLEHGGGGGGGGGSGGDPRIQREKKAAALAARGGGADRFGRNRKPVYVSMQPRAGGYQPELCLDPPQDLATGYPIDPALQYGFGVMPQVPSHRHFA